jgi:glycerophosphoryl diester phosphodiesterase
MAQRANGVWLSLAPTKDGRLAVVSSVDISDCTDVRRKVTFASRFGSRKLVSKTTQGWFAVDFTAEELAELNYAELRPRMRKQSAEISKAAPEPITMFRETVESLMTQHKGTQIWVEFLLPSQVAEWGFDYAQLVEAEMAEFGRKVDVGNLVFVSSEKTLIRELRNRDLGPRIFYRTEPYGYANDESLQRKGAPRTYATELAPEGLKDLAQVCDGVIVDILQVFSQTGAEKTAFEILWQNTSLVAFAHAAGLEIAGAVLRAENTFRPQYLRHGVDPGGLHGWEEYFDLALDRGFDAIITDQPDLLVSRR